MHMDGGHSQVGEGGQCYRIVFIINFEFRAVVFQLEYNRRAKPMGTW